MAVAVLERRLGIEPAHADAPEPPRREGDWPHTTRLLPWALAAFLAMVWLLPFDSIQLPFPLPFDAKLDRLGLAALALLWLLSVAVGAQVNRYRRMPIVVLAIGLFAGLAVTSVLVNVELLSRSDSMTLAGKKLGLLMAYGLFLFLVVSIVRRSEVRNFVFLTLGLATLTAAGTVWEYRFGTNVFFRWSDAVLPGVFNVALPPVDPEFGRPAVTGPTTVGLCITTMLAMAVPFALVEVIRSPTRRRKLAWAVVLTIVLAGVFATVRKSSGVLAFASLGALLLYRPRAMIRLLPLGLVLALVIQGLAPGALNSVRGQLFGGGFTNTTTEDRKADYPAVTPDVKARPILGRGYGTYDASRFRTLDNQYLGLLIEVGVIGVGAWLLMLLFALLGAHRLARDGEGSVANPGVAAVTAIITFAVANALYDVLAFPQGPYVFFFIVGLTVILSPQLASSPRGHGLAAPPDRSRHVA